MMEDENKDALYNLNENDETKKLRRTKNDTAGRTYKCKFCGKSYLSYPALYTHSKQNLNNTIAHNPPIISGNT